MADVQNILQHYVQHHRQAVEKLLPACAQEFARLVSAMTDALRGGKKIMLCGNGGSAAEAQHIAAELAVKFHQPRPHLAALALTTDSSVLTAAGNDYDFAEIFAVQIRALGQKGDVLIAYTTSGNSKNVVRALAVGREMGLVTAAFCGQAGGSIEAYADIILRAPSVVTPHIQELHNILGHALCVAVEDQLQLVPFAGTKWAT